MKKWFSLLILGCSGCLFAAAEPVYYWSFSAGLAPDRGSAAVEGIPSGVVVDGGVRGRALEVGMRDKHPENVRYRLDKALPADRGAITFWIQGEWDGATREFRNFLLLTGGNGGSLELYRYHQSDGSFNVSQLAGGVKRFDTGSDMRLWKKNVWRHMAVAWDSESMAIYEDGRQKILARRTNPFPGDYDRLTLGRCLAGNPGITKLDEVRLYDRKLSPAEIREDMTLAGGIYRSGQTVLRINPAAGNYSIRLAGTDRELTSDGPLWTFRIFDDAAKKLNTNPLHGKGIYCGDPWREVPRVITSADADFLGGEFRDGRLTLRYRHQWADVELYFDLAPECVSVSGRIVNRGKDPICDFSAAPGIRFRLGDGETLIAPDPMFNGVEFSRVFSFSWGMCYAWDGCLIREADNRGFLAFDNAQDIDRRYLVSGGSLVGDGRNLVYSNRIRIFARSGETRTTSRLTLRHFADLRGWADAYVKLNFPRGLRKLSGKLDPATFEKLSRAYLAPAWGTIRSVADFLPSAPGRYIVHPPAWMHAAKGNSDRWDAFPNYFPPNPEAGTMDDYAKLIRSVVDGGQFFMPRTSFFYWGEGTDFALSHDLKGSAIVRVDGLPRTACWLLPGYLMSPSAKPVLTELDRIFDRWRSLGSNLYFTNVICALDPYNNRYDFHPDAPAPDLLYDRLYKLMKRYGEKLPLFSEGGGFWQLPYQTGFAGGPGWDKDQPISPVQDNPKRGIVKRAAFEVPLYLDHEYVQFYPHNTSYDDGPYTIQRLGFCLAHGVGLKCGFYTFEPMKSRNRLLLRTIALLADKVQSRLYGQRLTDYRCDDSGVVRADYAGNRICYNPSAKEVAFRAGKYDAVVAPDGFGFASADGVVAAGFFSKFAGNVFPEPVLLVLDSGEKKNAVRIYAPMEERAFPLSLDGKEANFPAYPAVLARRIPGVTLDSVSGAVAADPAPTSPAAGTEPETGSDTKIAAPPYRDRIPLKLDWQAGRELPACMAKFKTNLTPEGLRFPRGKEDFLFEDKRLVFNSSFYLEIVFCCNGEPVDPAQWGEINIIRPEPAGSRVYTRTIELRYHIYRDQLRFLLTDSKRKFSDLQDRVFTLKKGKYYHVIARWDGKMQSLTVNGKTVETRPLTGELDKNNTVWRLGDLTADLTVSLLRIGGTRGRE